MAAIRMSGCLSSTYMLIVGLLSLLLMLLSMFSMVSKKLQKWFIMYDRGIAYYITTTCLYAVISGMYFV